MPYELFLFLKCNHLYVNNTDPPDEIAAPSKTYFLKPKTHQSQSSPVPRHFLLLKILKDREYIQHFWPQNNVPTDQVLLYDLGRKAPSSNILSAFSLATMGLRLQYSIRTALRHSRHWSLYRTHWGVSEARIRFEIDLEVLWETCSILGLLMTASCFLIMNLEEASWGYSHLRKLVNGL